MAEKIWLSWEDQIRNISMSTLCETKLYTLLKGKGIKRYLRCIGESLRIVHHNRPQVVFCQNPSIVLVYLMLFLKLFFKFKLIIDAHYVGVVSIYKNRLFQVLLDTANYYSDLVIVTNINHKKYVESIGGRAIVFEDPLPDIKFDILDEIKRKLGKKVFVICSFDIDEPYKEIIDAAMALEDEGITFEFSGDCEKINRHPSTEKNITFLGYVSRREYEEKLIDSDVVIDLTNLENCLVCGAYEAIIAEKPVLLTSTEVNKNFFSYAAVYVENKSANIEYVLRHMFLNIDDLKAKVKSWKTRYYGDVNLKLIDINNVIDSL